MGVAPVGSASTPSEANRFHSIWAPLSGSTQGSFVVDPDDVVGRSYGCNSSAGWLLRLEDAREIGVTRRPSRVGRAPGFEPCRQLRARIEDSATPDHSRNRVDRGHLHRTGCLECMSHAVPRKAGREQRQDGGHEQKQEVDVDRSAHTSTGARGSPPARGRRRIRHARRRRRRWVVPRWLPRREDAHDSIVEPPVKRLKPLEGRASGARFV